MAKVTVKSAVVESSSAEVEIGLKKLVAIAKENSSEVLKHIVLIASGLIDNNEQVSKEGLEQMALSLSQLEKNVSASMDVMRGVNLFLETLELKDGNGWREDR